MVRVLIAVALIVTAVGIAGADPTRKVEVTSTPSGASVYLNDPSTGELGKTPCTIDAPIGKSPIILELEGYDPLFEQLVVPRSGRKVSVSYTLQSAVGTLVVHGPEGATITVDEHVKGRVPDKVSVASGSHHVTVALKGATLFDDFISFQTGNETEITAKAAGRAPQPPDPGGDDPGGADSDGDTDGSDEGGDHQQPPASPPSNSIVVLGVQLNVGFRRLSYDNPHGSLNSDSGETENGQVLIGPAIELWPMRLAGIHAVPNLSLFVRLQFSLNHQPLTTQMGTGPPMPSGTSTSWSSIEFSLRHRWVLVRKLAIVGSGGFVRDALGFAGTSQTSTPIDVPDADYKSIRVGVRLALVGDLSPYLEAEKRFILSGGKFATQFMSASASGIYAAGGVMVHKGPIAAKAEGEITSYSWTFSADDPNATGATDKVFGFAVLVAYQY